MDDNPDYNTDTVMKYYLSKGASKSKLIVGIPFYGQSFTTRSTPRAYSEETDGPGTAGTWTKQRGMLAYYEICSKVRAGWTRSGGSEQQGTYALSWTWTISRTSAAVSPTRC